MRSLTTLAISLSLLVFSATLPGCTRSRASTDGRERPRELPPIAFGPAQLQLADARNRPRLVLDATRLARLKQAARDETPAWQRQRTLCDEATGKPVGSGYQGFDWADAVAGLALCWRASGETEYAHAALRHYRALLDDRFAVGDGKGGAGVVRHDDGYGIRTFGAYTALGYDWLRGAPGFDAALRKRAVTRLDEWLSWYARSGYLNDHPHANYFWGYLTALSFAGLAVGDDAPEAKRWLAESRRLLSTKALPAFRTQLAGGDWAEGWQYAEYVALQAALVAEAYESATGVALAKELPWLGEVVDHHVQALAPDRSAVYGGGTWGERPSQPSALGLSGIAIALDGLDDRRAAEARWLLDHALPPLTREHAWARLLAERPDAPRRDPRAGRATSRHLPGTGLTFARSDWSDRAVWLSFQAGPRLAPDHQHADQGHFELWRGGDWLIVDGGSSEGEATINHNSLLVDDGGKLITYSPNQGVWGSEVRTRHFADDGRVMVVVGDIGDAWAPACVREGCSERAVTQAVRSLVYVRPALLVIEDRVALADPSIGVTWIAHLTGAPALNGARASLKKGSSRVELELTEPADVGFRSVREPTPSGDGVHRANEPWGPMWRLEAESRRGARERRFVHTIAALDAKSAPAVAQRIAGQGLSGTRANVEGKRVAVLFADGSDAASAELGTPPDTVVVAGLQPGASYAVTATRQPACRLQVRRGGGRAASAAGFFRLDAPCGR